MDTDFRFNEDYIPEQKIWSEVNRTVMQYYSLLNMQEDPVLFEIDSLLRRVDRVRSQCTEKHEEEGLSRSRKCIKKFFRNMQEAVSHFHRVHAKFAPKESVDYSVKAAWTRIFLWRNIDNPKSEAESRKEYMQALWVEQVDFAYTSMDNFLSIRRQVSRNLDALEGQDAQYLEKSFCSI